MPKEKKLNSKIKTTVRINTYLKRLAEEKAKKEGLKLQFIVNEALRLYLTSQKKDKSWVDKLAVRDVGKIKYPLTRENFYKSDEELD
ncbi:hypothetical protein COV24_01195 [candidate division WWE3 bacterium CG10_big_fil_rev_8_21_14_0_10_32_10]|uniref:Ribbon-helix-helix protein CopG domain-containing protein n=1 Tax=candidate division WWE3 bacterium CG10_big_fil_rev_8_21_14_0_10_32_10 TaxID=1975090 RepID=A0A2H0RB92_UNCKA|nr:MAG: hypothetical protein COV24_01195 [candidate division WWE3 bacterium CG10_big_fil_rev_8_21_14_0_10_32_10]